MAPGVPAPGVLCPSPDHLSPGENVSMIKRLVRRAEAVAPLPGWLLVAGLYVLSVVWASLRLRMWGPDSRYYLAWAYRYAGYSEVESAQRTYDFLGRFAWFRDSCQNLDFCWPADLTNGYPPLFHGFTGGLVAPRVLYPLLSAPFVSLFGPSGMLVVPLISYTICLVLVVVLASRVIGRRWAVLAAFAAVMPISMARWSLYAYTEALTMALSMACVVVLPLARRTTRRDLVLFGGFLFLFAFTRQFHAIVVVGVAVAWLGVAARTRRLRNEWLPFLGVGAGVMLFVAFLQSFMSKSYSLLDWFLMQSGAGTIGGAPAAVVRVVWRVVRADGWWITGDFALVVVLSLFMLGVLYRLRSPLVLLTVGMTLATFALNILNTLPSNFRYFANVVPLFAIVATAVVAELVGGRTPPGFVLAPRAARTRERAPEADPIDAEPLPARTAGEILTGRGPTS